MSEDPNHRILPLYVELGRQVRSMFRDTSELRVILSDLYNGGPMTKYRNYHREFHADDDPAIQKFTMQLRQDTELYLGRFIENMTRNLDYFQKHPYYFKECLNLFHMIDLDTDLKYRLTPDLKQMLVIAKLSLD